MPEAQMRDDPVAAYLVRTDHRCPRCGHALRGATSGCCPECGEAIRLEPVALSGSSAWWLMAAFGAGVDVLLAGMMFLTLLAPQSIIQERRLSAMVSAGLSSASDLPDWPGMIASLLLLLGSGGLLCGVIGARRRVIGLPGPWRVAVGVGSLLSPLLLLGLLFVFLRLR